MISLEQNIYISQLAFIGMEMFNITTIFSRISGTELHQNFITVSIFNFKAADKCQPLCLNFILSKA